MTDVSLHAMPRWRDVVLEQIRIVGLSLRREGLIAIAVLVIVTFPVVAELVRGGPGFDSNEMFPTAVVSFLVPFAIWRREQQFGPGFLWTLPVDRRRLALAKVFAGWVWMMTALTLFVAWLTALGMLAHMSPARVLMRVPFVATTAMYMLGSALVLGLRHPLRWLLGTAGVFFLLTTLTGAMGRTASGEWRIVAWSSVLRWMVYGPYGLRTLLNSSGFFFVVQDAGAGWETLPGLTRWAITTFLWLGVGLAALWAAASRHRERRRR